MTTIISALSMYHINRLITFTNKHNNTKSLNTQMYMYSHLSIWKKKGTNRTWHLGDVTICQCYRSTVQLHQECVLCCTCRSLWFSLKASSGSSNWLQWSSTVRMSSTPLIAMAETQLLLVHKCADTIWKISGEFFILFLHTFYLQLFKQKPDILSLVTQTTSLHNLIVTICKTASYNVQLIILSLKLEQIQ